MSEQSHEFLLMRNRVKILQVRVEKLESDLSVLTRELLKVFGAICAINEKTGPAVSGETNKQTKT